MHGVGRLARFEVRALALLANEQAVSTAFCFTEIFSRFFHLHASIWRRRFLAHEHEHAVVIVLEIEREIFRQLALSAIVIFHRQLDQVIRSVEPRLLTVALVVSTGITNRPIKLRFYFIVSLRQSFDLFVHRDRA